MSPSANQYPVFYRPDALPCHPTNSIRALKETTAQCLYVHIVAPTAQHWYRNLELNFTAKLSILSSVGLKSHASSTTWIENLYFSQPIFHIHHELGQVPKRSLKETRDCRSEMFTGPNPMPFLAPLGPSHCTSVVTMIDIDIAIAIISNIV